MSILRYKPSRGRGLGIFTLGFVLALSGLVVSAQPPVAPVLATVAPPMPMIAPVAPVPELALVAPVVPSSDVAPMVPTPDVAPVVPDPPVAPVVPNPDLAPVVAPSPLDSSPLVQSIVGEWFTQPLLDPSADDC